MIPSLAAAITAAVTVYQRGVAIDSQPYVNFPVHVVSISKGSGD